MMIVNQDLKQISSKLRWTGVIIIVSVVITACGVRESTSEPEQDIERLISTDNVTTPIRNADSTGSSSKPTPTLDIYREYGQWEEITYFREELLRTDLSDDTRHLLETNLAQAEFEAEHRATAQVGPTAVRRGPPAAVQDVRPTPVRGIDNTFNGIKGIRIANVWRGPVDGIWFNIHAASLEDDRSQGLLYFRAVDVMEAPLEIYQTPTKNGIVKVIAEQNDQLTLEAEDGTLFVFDIPSREFVDSSLAVTPTPTVVTE